MVRGWWRSGTQTAKALAIYQAAGKAPDSCYCIDG